MKTTNGNIHGKVKLRFFNPLESSMKKSCFNLLIIGKKHTGKSTLMKDLMFWTNVMKYPRAVIFSGTEDANSFYSSFIPSVFIHNDCTPEKLEKIFKAQMDIVSQCRKNQDKENLKIDTRLVFIVDDLTYQKKAMSSEILRQIFMNGRHWDISIIVGTQYVLSIPPDIRANVDFLFCLKENVPMNKKRLYNNYFGCFEKFSDFSRVLDTCTNNYEALVLDNTIPSSNKEETCFWYKAKQHHFRFGSSTFWKFGNNMWK